ncbi:MAG: transcriptional repressor [Clostridia bacterium]|nr:transcriptional repressor [Clostridia bacterium]
MADYRKKILDIVLSSEDHPTADDVYVTLRKEGTRVALATVYNNLNALCDEGLIRKVSLDGKCDHYDKPTKHDHIVCRVCGKFADIHLEDFTKKFSEESGLAIEGYDLKLIYVCPECRQKLQTT